MVRSDVIPGWLDASLRGDVQFRRDVVVERLRVGWSGVGLEAGEGCSDTHYLTFLTILPP